jgi:hypothetical protein
MRTRMMTKRRRMMIIMQIWTMNLFPFALDGLDWISGYYW